MDIHVGLNVSPSEDFRLAALPLFEAELVDAIEWNLDMGWGGGGAPAWVDALRGAYAAEGRLHGHGVEFSLLSAELSPRQERWLETFRAELARFRYGLVSEHFGFLTAGEYVGNTVIPHPRTAAALRVGHDRLARLSEIHGAPVGLENLALAFSSRDVDAQPDFLDALLEPTGGFVLFDLHNLYCQAQNFGRDPVALAERYPLARVRAIHLAGGELDHPASDPEKRAFRRDGHSTDVPDEVLALLAHVVPRCPSLELVVVERSDHSIHTAAEIDAFRERFHRVRAIVLGEPG